MIVARPNPERRWTERSTTQPYSLRIDEDRIADLRQHVFTTDGVVNHDLFRVPVRTMA
jgi:hypothetical protein